ncbi:hypothetical protein DFH28DRAFT_171772 [Melampsora americana]|nr:hypothetical protein DFH28DRAFT_171772 [Melampsora americana]
MTKFNIHSIKLPELKHQTQESINPSDLLPEGWKMNEKNEVLNELGLVMVNIEEEEEEEKEEEENEKSDSNGFLTDSNSFLTDSSNRNQNRNQNQNQIHEKLENKENESYRLPNSINEILNRLEQEEEEELKKKEELEERIEKESKKNFDLESESESNSEVDENENIKNQNQVNLNKEGFQKIKSEKEKEKEKEELKNWGLNGLEGLKNVFQSNRSSHEKLPSNLTSTLSIQSSKPIQTETKPSCSSSINTSTSISSKPEALGSSSLTTSKSKKSVSFALESDSSKDSSINPSTSTLSTGSLPKGGIMLPDIIEHPIKLSSSGSIQQAKSNQINGQNAHLHPRLASLLPKSYLQSQLKPNPNLELDRTETDFDEPEGSSSSSEGDEGLYELSEEEEEEEDQEEGEWEDELDIQRTLDLREAALEYHSRRQGLGIGIGTGSLGGEGIPIDENEEEEWVPIERRVKGDGIPRQIPNSSRFKSGRLSVSSWKSKWVSTSDLKEDHPSLIQEGKLFGIEPVFNGPIPKHGGSVVYEVPGRREESNEIDEDLTQEELELMNARINILSMDEESRRIAERAGEELMGWMEKVKKGEVVIEDEAEGEGFVDPVGLKVKESESSDLMKGMKEVNFKDEVDELISSRTDLPPEIKIVSKTKSKLMEKDPQLSIISSSHHTHEDQPMGETGSDLKSNEIKIKSTLAKKVSRFKSEKLKQSTRY